MGLHVVEAASLVRRASESASELVGSASQTASQVGLWFMLSPAVCGMLGSLLAGNIIYPNDTVRRRLQTEAGSRETYLQATRMLLKEGGISRLYRGFLLYNLKAAPSAAVQFYTYHTLKQLWIDQSNATKKSSAGFAI